MSSYRNLILVVLVLLVGGAGFAIWKAGQEVRETPPAQQTAPSTSDMTGRKASFIVTEGELKKWKLEAEKVLYDDKRNTAKLDVVSGEFYDADGKVVLTFTAPKGDYTSRNNKVVLTGGVVAKGEGEKGGEMTAPTMTWDAKSQEIEASGGAHLKFSQGISEAETCRFTMDFSKITLRGGVSSIIRQPG